MTFGIYRPDRQLDTTYQSGDQELLADFGDLLLAGGSEIKIVPDIQREKYKKNIWYVFIRINFFSSLGVLMHFDVYLRVLQIGRNLGFSTYTSLIRYPLSTIFQSPNPELSSIVVSQIRLVLNEYLSVLHAMGYSESDFPSSSIEDTIEATAKIHSEPGMRHKASMLLDIELGKPIEVEVIVGEVVRAAKALGVECPVSLSLL